jgi:CRISPR-associated exonuclease Cas4
MTQSVILVVLVLVLAGAPLLWWAAGKRHVQGLGNGETVALDDVTLYSERLQLVGRPDRIIRDSDTLIPEEWKSSKRINQGHRLQLGAYFLLIEEEFGVRPPYGVVVLGDGSRSKIPNDSARKSSR